MPHSHAGVDSSSPKLRRHRLPLPRNWSLSIPAASAAKRIQYRAEAAGFRSAEKLARLLGLERSTALFAFAWRHLGPLSARHRRAKQQLALAFPDLPLQAQRQILDRMWDNLGRVFAEAFHMDRLFSEPGRLQVDEASRRNSQSGPVVFATLHMGNWELAALAATQMGCELAGIYQRVKNPDVDARIAALRAPFYRGGLLVKGSNLVPTLLARGRLGAAIGIVSDLRDPRGIEVPFFGRPAPSTPFPAYIAHKLNIPLLAARVVRLKDSYFKVEVVDIPIPQTGDRMQDIQTATVALQSTFETWIRECPEQWMWMHRRWG